MVKVVKLGDPDIPILMVCGALMRQSTQDKVWIIGVKKPFLENVIGIEVLDSHRLNMFTYAFLIKRKDYNEYVWEHKIPYLVYYM